MNLFPKDQPLEVELGSGDGSFLVGYAKLHPERNFIGVERLLGRIRKTERKALRAGTTNVRLARIESAYLVQFLLPLESVSALHIYFPDPWPKRRHWERRLVNAAFPGIAHKALKPGGIIFLRTDDEEYFQQMTQVFSTDKRFEPVETAPELFSVQTDFERGFVAKGIKTLLAAYRRD